MRKGAFQNVNAYMRPRLQLANAMLAWENATTARTCKCGQRRRAQTFAFRQFGDALADLVWGDECVIRHIETLSERKGAATALVEFLKQLADEHRFVLSGTATVYPPCCNAGKELLTQDQLEKWYGDRGFDVHPSECGAKIRYPKLSSRGHR